MALEAAGGLGRKLRSLSVIDTARGSRRIARETRQAGAAGAPRNRGVFNPQMLRGAFVPALRKLDPRQMLRNPVMFVVEVTAALGGIDHDPGCKSQSRAAQGFESH